MGYPYQLNNRLHFWIRTPHLLFPVLRFINRTRSTQGFRIKTNSARKQYFFTIDTLSAKLLLVQVFDTKHFENFEESTNYDQVLISPLKHVNFIKTSIVTWVCGRIYNICFYILGMYLFFGTLETCNKYLLIIM